LLHSGISLSTNHGKGPCEAVGGTTKWQAVRVSLDHTYDKQMPTLKMPMNLHKITLKIFLCKSCRCHKNLKRHFSNWMLQEKLLHHYTGTQYKSVKFLVAVHSLKNMSYSNIQDPFRLHLIVSHQISIQLSHMVKSSGLMLQLKEVMAILVKCLVKIMHP
jgi:hypothetical protein